MIINYLKEGIFEIKTSKGKITTGEQITINEFVLPGVGEYEVGEIQVEVIDNITIFHTDGMSLGYLDKRKKPLEEKEIERISDIDILFVPVGGGDVFDAKEALAAISAIEPKIVIPMHYKDLSDFRKAEGSIGEGLESFKISRDKLPTEERQIIVLNPKN